MGCPVYLAVHLRNLPVLHTLLKASVKSVSLTCLTSLDVNGETALHSAVKSKAAGLARLYSKLLTFNGSTVTSAPPHHKIASLLGLAHKVCTSSLYYLSSPLFASSLLHSHITETSHTLLSISSYSTQILS